jgi:FkbM family methyltransferase
MKLALIKRQLLNKGALWLSYIKLIPILKKINKDSIVLDCGANTGDISLKFAKRGATVYSFEPDPLAYNLLIDKVKKYPDVTCIQKGVWDKNEQVALYTHKDQEADDAAFTVGSSIKSDKVNVDREKAQFIEVIDLSAFIKQLGKKIDVIKLDVEGAETEILKKILSDETYNCFDMMYVETHETKIPGQREELEQIRKTMKEKGVENIKLNWL